MDPKKQQNLTPELKQIYERVMNTPVASQPTAQTPSQPAQTPPVTTQPDAVKPNVSAQTPPPSPINQAPQTPNPAPPSTPPINPRPLTGGGNQFTFSSKTQEGQEVSKTNISPKGKKGISAPIIGVLIVTLIAVWSLFWMKFFNLI